MKKTESLKFIAWMILSANPFIRKKVVEQFLLVEFQKKNYTNEIKGNQNSAYALSLE